MVILIPSYQPTTRLLEVIDGLISASPDLPVLVVDDGSGPRYASVFAAARGHGAEVIGYETNRGKGHALKFGLRHLRRSVPGEDVVTADSDGQHTTIDILRVVDELSKADGAIVLGGRRFSGDVPPRSRFGNAVSRRAFSLATGVAVHDTQTGLRGLPAGAVPWLLTVKGNRFEYELNVLLGAAAAGYTVREIPIDTVYLEHNASSHFRPIIDSVRVLAPVLAFALSSFGSFLVDSIALQVLFLLTGSLSASVVGARLLSATLNFALNRHVVFRAADRRELRRQVVRYLVLAVALLASSYVWLAVLTGWGVPLLVAKVVTDSVLYILSFQVQRRFVFAKRSVPSAASVPPWPAPLAPPSPVSTRRA